MGVKSTNDDHEDVPEDQLPKKPKYDWLEIVRTVATSLGVLLIPVAVAYLGATIDKSRTRDEKILELAINILSRPASEETRGVRAWSVNVLNAYSPIPLPPRESANLIEKFELYPKVGPVTYGLVGVGSGIKVSKNKILLLKSASSKEVKFAALDYDHDPRSGSPSIHTFKLGEYIDLGVLFGVDKQGRALPVPLRLGFLSINSIDEDLKFVNYRISNSTYTLQVDDGINTINRIFSDSNNLSSRKDAFECGIKLGCKP